MRGAASRFGICGAILVVGIGLTLFAAERRASLQATARTTELRRESEEIVASLQTSIRACEHEVRLLAAFLSEPDQRERRRFQGFAETSLRRCPQVEALEWVPRVYRENREFYERAAREQGLGDFAISERDVNGQLTPARIREEHFPIYLVEPMERNRSALGFDLGSNAIRLEALRTACDRGRITASRRIQLLRGERGNAGILLLAPVYDDTEKSHTVEQRRSSLAGYAIAVLQADSLVDRALSGLRKDNIDTRVFDATGLEDVMLFGAAAPASEGLPVSRTIEVADRGWRIACTSRTPPPSLMTASLGAIALGIALTIALSVLAFALIGRTARINQLVKERTEELANAMKLLDDARANAESANASKSAFLANMSHEIRTPMTAILGFCEVLREELVDLDSKSTVDRIHRNGEHLLTIINDILDLSKIEAGKLDVEQVVFEPWELIHEVIDLMSDRASGKGITISLSHRTPLPPAITSDPTRIRQILINLIGNAVKFTEVGGVEVLVGAESHEGSMQLEVCVRDTGIGMTEEQLSRLFQPFEQADTSTTRRFGGTGLGLVISLRLAERLGGGITAFSQAGKGSEFVCRIDTGLAHDAEVRMPTTVKRRASAPVREKASCDGRRVLLADDGPDNQRLISHVLRKAGADVVVVGDGQEALDTALAADVEATPFDVVLMDMQMPVLDGYEATQQLREQGYDRSIVAITAHAMDSDRERCLNAGCDAFTTKPLKIEELLGLVAEAPRKSP